MRFRTQNLRTISLPPGEWSFSTEYEAVCAMQQWGLIPSQWRELPDDDRALIIAWHRTRNTMAAVEAQEQERALRKARHGKNRS